MDIMPQTAQGQLASVETSTRNSTVATGRQDSLSIVLRLISAEMYKVRRRAMPKLLLIAGMCIITLAFLILAVNVITDLNTPLQEYGALYPCSHVPPEGRTPSTGQTCINHPPTRQELVAAQKIKQEVITAASMPLRLPVSLYTSISVIMIVGTLLLIILTGTIVGGEYSGGTIRLMSTRGPTRIQFLLSKIGAILICLMIGFVVILLTGIVAGTLLNLLSGVPTSWNFLNKGEWNYALLYLLAAMFGLFVYAMLALFLATLGRTTVAGVTGAIVWVVVENSLSSVSNVLPTGPVASALKTISHYLISNNISALLQNQTQYFHFTGDSPPTLTNLHAMLVLIGYLVVFITISIWVSVRRDITN